MTKLSSLFLLLIISFSSSAAVIAPGGGGGGGGISGSITGSVWFPGPFTVSGTNWYLNAGISNIAVTGVSEFATNRTLVPSIFTNAVYVNANGSSQAANGVLLTNAWVSAPQYSTIVVGPGDYYFNVLPSPSPAFGRDNRRIHFMPGANVRVGSTNADASLIFDDTAGKVTNVWVTGYGNFYQTNLAGASGGLLYLDSGSKVYFEHMDYYATNADSAFTIGSSVGNNTLEWKTFGRASTWSYDNAYFTMTATNRVRAFFNEIESVGDIIELGGNAPEWGDVEIQYNRAWARNATDDQASIMQIGGRAKVINGTLTVERSASIYSTSATTNGIFEGGVVIMPPNGDRSFLQDNSAGTGAPFNGLTALWLKNMTVICPTNVDALTLTNGTTAETILENVTFHTGFASTNLIRAATPSKVRIIGSLGVFPFKGFGSGITLVGTNVSSALYNVGTFTNTGAASFGNSVLIDGGNLTIRGYDIDNNQSIYTDSMFVTNIFYLPNGASPSPDGFGSLVADNNLWASGRGAVLHYDGTANTALIGVLTSDTPSNGQVPTFNTGGTITWETPSAGSGSTNMITFAAGSGTITNSLTVGLGATAPSIVSLSSFQGDSFALTRATNAPAGTGTTNDIQIAQSATAGQALVVHANTSGQLVWTNGTVSSSTAAGAWIPNLSYDVLYEPWATGLKGIGSGNNGALGWYISTLGSGASSTILTAPDAGHWGCYRLTTGTTQGAGIGVTIGDSTASSTMPLPALSGVAGWTNIWIFKLSATNDLQLWVGSVHGSFSASTNDPSAFIGLKCNSATNGTFEFVTRSGGTSSIVGSGVSIATGWHTNWIWSTTAGTISFKLNNGSTQTLNSNVPTTEWSPFVFAAKQAATTSVNVDLDTYLGIFSR